MSTVATQQDPRALFDDERRRMFEGERGRATFDDEARRLFEEEAAHQPTAQMPGADPVERAKARLREQAGMGPVPDAVPSVSSPPFPDPRTEQRFQSWYGQRAATLGLDPNPDAPEHQYDYRRAFEAGAEPGPDRHWPSAFKLAGHPNRYVDGVDTITGEPQGSPPQQGIRPLTDSEFAAARKASALAEFSAPERFAAGVNVAAKHFGRGIAKTIGQEEAAKVYEREIAAWAPRARGVAGTVGEVVGAAPGFVAAGLNPAVGLPALFAAGHGNARADMDAWEKATGKTIPEGERAAIAAGKATIDTLMGLLPGGLATRAIAGPTVRQVGGLIAEGAWRQGGWKLAQLLGLKGGEGAAAMAAAQVAHNGLTKAYDESQPLMEGVGGAALLGGALPLAFEGARLPGAVREARTAAGRQFAADVGNAYASAPREGDFVPDTPALTREPAAPLQDWRGPLERQRIAEEVLPGDAAAAQGAAEARVAAAGEARTIDAEAGRDGELRGVQQTFATARERLDAWKPPFLRSKDLLNRAEVNAILDGTGYTMREGPWITPADLRQRIGDMENESLLASHERWTAQQAPEPAPAVAPNGDVVPVADTPAARLVGQAGGAPAVAPGPTGRIGPAAPALRPEPVPAAESVVEPIPGSLAAAPRVVRGVEPQVAVEPRAGVGAAAGARPRPADAVHPEAAAFGEVQPDAPAVDAGSTTSARARALAKDRQALALETLPPGERKSWERALEEARAQEIPERAARIVDDITAKPRALSDVETAGLAVRAAELKSEHRGLVDRIEKAATADDLAGLGTELARVENEFDDLTRAMRVSGTEKGRALASQKLTLDRDYSLLSVLARAKATKGLELSPVERGRFSELTGKLDKAEAQLAAIEPKVKARLQKQIAEMEARIAAGLSVPKTPPKVLGSPDLERLLFERDTLRQNIERRIDGMRAKGPLHHAGEVSNLVRNFITGFDLSPILRQAQFVTVGHPLLAAKSIWPMLRSFASRQKAHAATLDIYNRQNAALYRRAGLALTEIAGHISKQEEAVISGWTERLPLAIRGESTGAVGGLRTAAALLPEGVAGSARAYTTFLNKVRADAFDVLWESLPRRGGRGTLDEARAIANYVNIATGRGGHGRKIDSAMPMMSHLFFAPRLVLSRFEMLAGRPFWSGTAATRKIVAGEYARYLVGATTMYALGKLAGADIETDPRSSDFLKMRFGRTRIDPFGGLQQVGVLLARLWSGEQKRLSGEVVPIAGENVPFGSRRVGNVLWDFTRSKFAPLIGTALDLREGQNVVGEKVGPKEAALNLTVPLSARDLQEAIEAQGVERGTAMGILSLFGASAQTHRAE